MNSSYGKDDFPPLNGGSVPRSGPTGAWAQTRTPQYHGVSSNDNTKKISFSISSKKDARKAKAQQTTIPKPNPTPLKPPPYRPPISVYEPKPAPVPPPPTSNSISYPASLSNYITRSLSQTRTAEEHAFVEQAIKKMIMDSCERNDLWTFNWDSVPIPKLQRKKEKEKITITQSTKPEISTTKNKNQKKASKKELKAKELSKAQKKKAKVKASPSIVVRTTSVNLGKRKKEFLLDDDDFLHKNEKRKRMKRFESMDEDDDSSLTITISPKQKRKSKLSQKQSKEQRMIGTCTKLEKSFYRQVSEPDPELIRPEKVLHASLNLLKRKWKGKEVDYVYICDQMKAIRQDMTIQGIKNQFTIEVYETHARLALENNDFNEFNQCQTKLKTLYQNIQKGHPEEFTAYRILYLLSLGIRQDFSALLYAIQDLTPEQKLHPFINHAIKTKRAVITRNYHAFFKLFQECPNMGGYLLDEILDTMRVTALKCIAKAYFPTVPIQFLSKELLFPSEASCNTFLRQHGAKFKTQNGVNVVDTKLSKIV